MFDDADFESLRADRTAKYPLDQIHIPRGNPLCVVLELKHMGDSNKAWKNAALKAPRKFGDQAEQQSVSRFCRYVIIGWENVLDKDGKPIPYTQQGGEEIFAKLRSVDRGDIVGGIYAFAANAENFRAPITDAGDLGNA